MKSGSQSTALNFVLALGTLATGIAVAEDLSFNQDMPERISERITIGSVVDTPSEYSSEPLYALLHENGMATKEYTQVRAILSFARRMSAGTKDIDADIQEAIRKNLWSLI